jgi:3',5'-cyclic AMP phosphodiesterase CpdA
MVWSIMRGVPSATAAAKAKTTGDEPLYGKQWACEQFGRDLPYESFDRGGWHIVLLDSVFPHADSYIGKLDDAQWDWLEKDLAAVPPATPDGSTGPAGGLTGKCTGVYIQLDEHCSGADL